MPRHDLAAGGILDTRRFVCGANRNLSTGSNDKMRRFAGIESGWFLVVAPVRGFILVSAAAILLVACSFTEDALWPSLTGEAPSGAGLTGEAPSGAGEQVMIPASEAAPSDEAVYGDASSQPITRAFYEPESALMASSPTGTFVGAKVAQQRSELENLKASVNNRRIQFEQVRNTTRQNSQSYFATIAAVRTPSRDELLSTKTETASAAVAGGDTDVDFVDEHGSVCSA